MKGFIRFCFRIVYNETTASSRLIIKNFWKSLTALCLKKTNENSNEKLQFTLVAYPGDGNETTSKTRRYQFSDPNSTIFHFNKTKTSLFNCIQVDEIEATKSHIQLRYSLNHEGLIWSDHFKGAFCCYALIGKKPTPECAVMRFSNVSELHEEYIKKNVTYA